jgi:hypothetical protein
MAYKEADPYTKDQPLCGYKRDASEAGKPQNQHCASFAIFLDGHLSALFIAPFHARTTRTKEGPAVRRYQPPSLPTHCIKREPGGSIFL